MLGRGQLVSTTSADIAHRQVHEPLVVVGTDGANDLPGLGLAGDRVGGQHRVAGLGLVDGFGGAVREQDCRTSDKAVLLHTRVSGILRVLGALLDRRFGSRGECFGSGFGLFGGLLGQPFGSCTL